MAAETGRNSRESEEETQRSLRSMLAEDLRVRGELVRSGTLSDTYHSAMEDVHLANAERLEAILHRHGWPDAARFGPDGQDAAWTILMHSISRPDVRRLGRGVLARAVESGAAPGHLLARLEDRIRTLEGRHQTYGTILDWDDRGALSPLPILDPDRVDDRRASVGLPPLADHVEACRATAEQEGAGPPKDPSRKALEYELWLEKTGWR